MTEFEARATGGLGAQSDSGWSRFLMPILTAALVLVLGLVMVGLTNDNAEMPLPDPPTSGASSF